MSFLAPYLLWGALAAGIPVAIHFFFRSRFRTVPWAAMEFLVQAVEQTSRRLKFQELLLLILRCALLLLLAIALARPTTRLITGAGDAVDAVLVIDTSMSMDARHAGVSRLQHAAAAAKAVIEHLPPHSTAQIIAVSDRAELLNPRRAGDLDHAQRAIEEIAVTARGSDLSPGLRAAIDALKRGTAAQREVYVFSDMQARAFDAQAAAVAEAFRGLNEQATVYLCRCGSSIPRNATLVGIASQSGLPHTGERIGLAVLVKNTGSEPLRDLTVTLTLDGDESRRETQPIARLETSETRSVTLGGRWSAPGLRTVTARVRSDDLPTDDRLDQVVPVRDRVRVLVVDGATNEREPEKSASYFLAHALLPVKDADKPRYHVQPRIISAAQASPELLADADVCILVNAAVERDPARPGDVLSAEFAEALGRFVRDGRSLVLFAGDRVRPADYNRLFLDRLELLPMRLTESRIRPERAEVGFDRTSAGDPAFWRFRDDETYQAFAQVKTSQSLDGTELPAQAGEARTPPRMLLRFTDGRPAVISRGVGAGMVALVTTSADVSWTDAPLWVNVYVPLVDALLTQLLMAEAGAHNTTAGAGIRWFPPASGGERSYARIAPDGGRVRLGPPELVQGRQRVRVADTPSAGLYHIVPADAETPSIQFAVIADLEESEQPEVLADARIDERLGFAPLHLTVGDDLSAFAGGERAKGEWTPWLLRVLLALAVVEMVFAWWVSRPR